MTPNSGKAYDEVNDPAEVAADLIERTGQVSPPLDLNRVAALWLGVRISSEDIDNEGYIIDLGTQGAEIIVKATDSPARQRFTIAHELGHWILATATRGCGPGLRLSGRAFPSKASKERWCDRFAVNLLMPALWITKHLGHQPSNAVVDAVLRGPTVYKVSQQAFRLRVSELTTTSIYELVVNRRGVLVPRRYESTIVSKRALATGLRIVIDGLLKGDRENRDMDINDDLLALQRKVRRTENADACWLIFVLPKDRPLFSRD